MTTSFAIRVCFDERRRRPQTFEVEGTNFCGLFACLYLFSLQRSSFVAQKGTLYFLT